MIYDKNRFDTIVEANYTTFNYQIDSSPILGIKVFKDKVYFSLLNGKIGFYDLKQDEVVLKKISRYPLYSIEVSDKYIITGDAKGNLYFVTNNMDLKKHKTIKKAKHKIIGLKLMPDNKLLLSSLNRIKIINLKNYKTISSHKSFLEKNTALYKNKILTAYSKVKLWDKKLKNPLYSFTDEKTPIISLVVKDDILTYITAKGVVKKWDLKTPKGTPLKRFKINIQGNISSMTIYKDLYFVSNNNNYIYIFNSNGMLLDSLNGFGKINKLSSDGKKLYIVNHNGELYIVDLELWEILNR
jgi:WD40 repeat protein